MSSAILNTIMCIVIDSTRYFYLFSGKIESIPYIDASIDPANISDAFQLPKSCVCYDQYSWREGWERSDSST